MSTPDNGNQSNQKRDRTVKTRKPMLKGKHKKRRKMGTRRFTISDRL